jgi:hypothetical protein
MHKYVGDGDFDELMMAGGVPRAKVPVKDGRS